MAGIAGRFSVEWLECSARCNGTGYPGYRISDYLTLEVLGMTKLKMQWVAGIGVTALAVVMAMGSAFADEGHGKTGHGGHDQEEQDEHSGHYLKHLLKHAKEIGLTPEQIGKLKGLQLDFKRTEARLEADAKIAKLELHALMEDEQADLSAIQAKID